MDEQTRGDLARALKTMKDRHGRKLAYDKIQKRMEAGIGGFAISTGAGVRSYFDPESIPEDPNMVNVLAMLDAMGFKIDDLPDHVAAAIRDELRGLRELLDRDAWPSLPV